MRTQVAIIGAGPSGLLLGQLLHKFRSLRTRSNKGHFTGQHIEYLWQFVDAGADFILDLTAKRSEGADGTSRDAGNIIKYLFPGLHTLCPFVCDYWAIF